MIIIDEIVNEERETQDNNMTYASSHLNFFFHFHC